MHTAKDKNSIKLQINRLKRNLLVYIKTNTVIFYYK